MMDNRKKTAVLCSLICCIISCGCGASGSNEVIAIGREGQESVQAHGDMYESTDQGASVPGAASTVLDGPAQTAADIRVYVCGAVEMPGVVSLPEGSRAEDALLAAGGFTEFAWREYVNLAERVEDGQKLYFPTLEEAERLVVQEPADGRVNINTADAVTLCTLPGIGESRARDIIAYRDANGAFESCEDIMKVPGIKTSVYSKISDRIKVR